MKIEDSGMPEESYWNSLFDISTIIEWVGMSDATKIVEIGCGYGTFTLPLAQLSINKKIISFDIEEQMLEYAKGKIDKAGLRNVHFVLQDVVDKGLSIEPDSIDIVLLFNILHSNDNHILLKEAYRVLKPGGMVAIIHWRKDIPTPRGPKVELRPDTIQIRQDSKGLNFKELNETFLAPYHWGLKLKKRV